MSIVRSRRFLTSNPQNCHGHQKQIKSKKLTMKRSVRKRLLNVTWLDLGTKKENREKLRKSESSTDFSK